MVNRRTIKSFYAMVNIGAWHLFFERPTNCCAALTECVALSSRMAWFKVSSTRAEHKVLFFAPVEGRWTAKTAARRITTAL